jgi:hypothetical protein
MVSILECMSIRTFNTPFGTHSRISCMNVDLLKISAVPKRGCFASHNKDGLKVAGWTCDMPRLYYRSVYIGQNATSLAYRYAEECVEGAHPEIRRCDVHLVPVAVGRMKYRGVCRPTELRRYKGKCVLSISLLSRHQNTGNCDTKITNLGILRPDLLSRADVS